MRKAVAIGLGVFRQVEYFSGEKEREREREGEREGGDGWRNEL
jgi:hypothetical protein